MNGCRSWTKTLTVSSFLFVSRLQAGAPLTEGVEVALDPSELELDPAAMQARWERYHLTFCYSRSCAIVIFGAGLGGFSFEFKSFEKLQRVCVMFFKGAWASVRCWNIPCRFQIRTAIEGKRKSTSEGRSQWHGRRTCGKTEGARSLTYILFAIINQSWYVIFDVVIGNSPSIPPLERWSYNFE